MNVADPLPHAHLSDVLLFAADGIRPPDIAHLLGLESGLVTSLVAMYQPIIDLMREFASEANRRKFLDEIVGACEV